jgi:hypothetical protein
MAGSTRRRLAFCVAAFPLASLAIAGCGRQVDDQPPSPEAGQPGTVALRYTKDVVSAKFHAAIALVKPAQRNTLRVLTDGTTPTAGSFRHLAIGGQHYSGDNGEVTLTGTMCRGGGGEPVGKDCVTNHSAVNPPPMFLVHLERVAGKWYVAYPATQPSGPPHVSPSTITTTAPTG